VAAAVCFVCVSPILILIQGQLADKTLQNPKPREQIAAGAVPPVYDRDAEVRGQAETDSQRTQIRLRPRIASSSSSSGELARNRDTQLQQEVERFNGIARFVEACISGGNSLRSPGRHQTNTSRQITSLKTVDELFEADGQVEERTIPGMQAADASSALSHRGEASGCGGRTNSLNLEIDDLSRFRQILPTTR
jgi:hypothetical protein